MDSINNIKEIFLTKSLTSLDIAILVIIGLFSIKGLISGFVSELFSVFSLSVIVYLLFSGNAVFITNFINGYVGSDLLSKIATFLCILIIGFLISLIKEFFRHKLGIIEMLFGMVLGFFQGLLLTFLVFLGFNMLGIISFLTRVLKPNFILDSFLETSIFFSLFEPYFKIVSNLFSNAI